MKDLIAAEWLKLRTTRLLYGMIPAAIVLSSAAVAGAVLSADGAATLETTERLQRVLALTGTGALVVLLLGIIISGGEYRHATAADTYLTTPRRDRVVAAKLAVGGGLGLATGVAIAVASVTIAALLYGAEGATFPFRDGGVWLTLAGTVAYTTLFSVLGVGLGAALRNQTLAVAVALAWLAVVEHTVVNLLPDLGRWLPAAAGQAVVRTPLEGLLSPLAGASVLAAYGVAAAVAGIRVVTARDA